MKSEAQTRKEIIDKKLRLAGWNLDDPTQVALEFDIDLQKGGIKFPGVAENPSPYFGHQFADYVLFLKGKPVAVVEAKKTAVDAGLGQEQAKQYAQNLQKVHQCPLPFIFYTNGHEIHCWESEFYPPVKVYGFPTLENLEWWAQRRDTRKPLSEELINRTIVERDYQIAAIRALLERMEKKQQKFLMVMATGTGKTRTLVALVDVLLRTRWAKRILFLVDRIALQEQALEAFKEFVPSEPRWPEQGERAFASTRRIYVTTYPAMLNLIQAGVKPDVYLSPHFFDLIVADESHRSLYNVYSQVLDYFHGLKVGLTATPKDHIDQNTFKLFDCDVYDPTFAYSFDEAVAHEPPYLCNFEVLKVRSKFQLEGVQGGMLPAPIQKKLVAEGKDVESIDFEGTDLERKVAVSGTNALIVREFMEECIKDPTGTLPGKSIIFAISMDHARRIQGLFDKLYPEHQGKLARVLVSEDRYVYGPGGLLDQFKKQDMPRVAISVDLLDTGVDVPEVVNLVFAKPIFSYVKFWQMIGRGSRVLNPDTKKRKPWCPEKDRFLIFDCWANFDFFKMNPKGREPGQQIPAPVRLFKSRLGKLEAALAKVKPEVAERVKKRLRADLEALPENNVFVIEKQPQLSKVRVDQFWANLTTQDIEYLRTTIAPILKARSNIDFPAMQFEIDVMEYGVAWLEGQEERMEALRQGIVEQVAELPLTVNIVAKEKALIEAVLGGNWWTPITDEKLEELIERLGPLMRFREKRKREMEKLDIEDLLVIKEWIEFGPGDAKMPTAVYRERVESFIRGLAEENPVLQKIQAGEAITEEELNSLGSLLEAQEFHVTQEILRKVYDHKTAGFLQFMRHILGLEKLESWSESVHKAFDEFIAQHNTFTSQQILFLQTLKSFILQKGQVAKPNLVEPPFTQIHPNGIRGVFRPEEIEEILQLTQKIAA